MPGGLSKSGKQALDLRGKGHATTTLGQEEGLDAEAVPGQDQAVMGTVEEGEGEHAQDVLQEMLAVFPVGVQDHLAVGMGEKAVPPGLQQGAQLDEVIDLAVGDQGEAAVGGLQGLMPAGQIDDRQPGVPHAEMTRDKGSLVIGSAMGQPRHGGLQGRDRDGAATIEEADDAAHEG
jgi:hypothetical protein